MSFPAYASYKDSEVEWLGLVPSHWSPTRLRFLAHLNPSKSEVSDLSSDTEVSFVPMDAIGERGELSLEQTRALSDVLTGYTYFREGDVSIAKITPCFENGKGAIMRGLSADVGFGTTELIIARPRPDATTPEFLDWLFRSPAFRTRGQAAMYGAGGQKRVPDDFVRDFFSPGAPLAEQVAISAFLDSETAKIDALIEEQRRLIALLKEKRQAVISHAIVKGLDPHVPMKDSGIEWLGSVPSHWNISRLKFHTNLLTSGSRGWSDFYADEGPIFVRIGNMTRDTIELDLCDIQRVAVPADAEGARTKLEPDDLLFSITAYLGSVAVVPEGLGDAYVSQHVALCRLNEGAPDAKWLGYLALSEIGRTHFDLQAYGGTKIQLSLSDIATLPVLAPPSSEQCEILNWLEAELGKHQSLEAEAAGAIALLIERREALVSAAVTGKIDVRQSAKILAFPIDRARARRFVATEIIERLAHQPTFGRTKLQKVAYLAEAHANITELAGCYIRMPFGPLDQSMMDEMEANGGDDGIVIDDKRDGSMVRYRTTSMKGGHTADLRKSLGEERFTKLDHLINALSDLKTHSAEAIATLYAVWNDALIEGRSPSDEQIISAFFGWHPKKGENFRANELPHWLDWMRRHGIVPTGSGPKTMGQMGTLL